MAFSLRAANGGTVLQLSLDDRGRVTSLTAGSLAFDAFALDFEIQDDLRHKIYTALEAAVENRGEGTFVYRWPDCDFTVFETFSAEGKKIVRRLRADPVPGAAVRAVAFRIPVSYPENV